jgi:hypothetical protein
MDAGELTVSSICGVGWLSRYNDGLWARRPGFDCRQSKILLFSTESKQALGLTQLLGVKVAGA